MKTATLIKAMALGAIAIAATVAADAHADAPPSRYIYADVVVSSIGARETIDNLVPEGIGPQ